VVIGIGFGMLMLSFGMPLLIDTTPITSPPSIVTAVAFVMLNILTIWEPD